MWLGHIFSYIALIDDIYSLMQIYMRCFPDLLVSEGEISDLSWHRIREASIWSINFMGLCVEEPKYECRSEGTSEHACSLIIWGWWSALIYSPGLAKLLAGLWLQQDPVIGGGPGAVYECVVSPHMNVHVPILLRLLERWLYFYHDDILSVKWTGFTTEDCIKSGWNPAAVITICIYISLSYNIATIKQH